MPEPVNGISMCAEIVDGLMLVVHGEGDPDSSEWSAYCDYAGAKRRAAGGTLRTLVLTPFDAGPNAGQRAEYKKKVAGPDNRVAVLCAGGMTRAILTAMSWFNADMKAFGAAEIQEGLQYLGTRSTPKLKNTIEQFQTHLASARQRNTG
jgi:hypothetical protein